MLGDATGDATGLVAFLGGLAGAIGFAGVVLEDTDAWVSTTGVGPTASPSSS